MQIDFTDPEQVDMLTFTIAKSFVQGQVRQYMVLDPDARPAQKATVQREAMDVFNAWLDALANRLEGDDG